MRKKNRWRSDDWKLPAFAVFFNGETVSAYLGSVTMAMSTFQKVTLATCLVLCVALLLPKMLLSKGRKDAAERPEGTSGFFLSMKIFSHRSTANVCITVNYFLTMAAVIKRRFCWFKPLFAFFSSCSYIFCQKGVPNNDWIISDGIFVESIFDTVNFFKNNILKNTRHKHLS